MRALAIILGVLSLIVVAVFFVGRRSAKNELELIKPYSTYKKLLYLGSGCDAYNQKYGTWPSNINQLRMFRPDLNEHSKDAFGKDILLTPYNAALGYGTLISYGSDLKPGGVLKQEQDIEIRFPSKANVLWNDQVGKQYPRPRLRP